MLSAVMFRSVVLAALFSVATTGLALADEKAARKCQAGKNGAVGKYAACLQKAHQKFVLGGGTDTDSYTEAVDKCAASYSTAWQKLEDKAGAGNCPSEGDESEVQGFIDACVAGVEDALAGGTLPLDVDACNTQLGEAVTDLGSCNTDLTTCSSGLTDAQQSLQTCTNDLGACAGALADAQEAIAAFETQIDCYTGARDVSTHGTSTCELALDGSVKCWGQNNRGQLGQGNVATRGDGPNEMGANLLPIDLGTGRTATAVVSGEAHHCALLENGSVKCWGWAIIGQLGLENSSNRGDGSNEMGDSLPEVSLGTGRTAVAITAGDRHTCALLDDGTVKCWGHNSDGRLGLGDTTHRGDNGGEMGDALPAVSLGTGRTAVAITAGSSHTCAVLDDASVKCWGTNGSGGLGLGDTEDRGDIAAEMGDGLPAVSLGTGRTAIAVRAGGSTTCAILDDGSVKCWGNNESGQLGLGDTTSRGDDAAEMGDNLPVVPLGTGRTATAIGAGTGHACALLDDDSLKCWGGNGFGQLGQGDTNARGDEAGELGDSLLPIDLGSGRTATRMTAGSHTCAVLDDFSIKCWGLNHVGQLGLGDTSERGDGAGEMGDSLPQVQL